MCYHIAGQPDGFRWWWLAYGWGGQTGCGGGVCHGQEVAVKANAGDSDASGGIWVPEDGGVPRGGYLKGLIYLKYYCMLVWVEQTFWELSVSERVMAVMSYTAQDTLLLSHRIWNERMCTKTSFSFF